MGFFSGDLNLFRVLGDLSHIASKLILIWAMHSNKSAEGVSLITQVFYGVVFISRYMDLFWTPVFVRDPAVSGERRFLFVYQFFGKTFYIATSIYIVFLMMRVYARTLEREKAWKLGAYCFGIAALAATPVAAIFQSFPKEGPYGFNLSQIIWTFSIILESVCVIPQLLLLRQTTVPTVIDSFYLFALGSYRAWYILSWIVRLSDSSHHFDPISVTFGILQTALYIDFFYVYYTRQRVKLRNGGIVDSEDIRQGLLVRRFMGKPKRNSADEEEGLEDDDPEEQTNNNRWGPRGISVSADDGVHDAQSDSRAPNKSNQSLKSPDAFEDDFDEDRAQLGDHDSLNGVGNGAEWREGRAS